MAKYDFNIIVIGAGAGGLVASLIAAAVNAKVALVEKHRMGGDCLNTGCVPSKTLIKSARMAHEMRQAHHYGLLVDEPKVDFKQVMHTVHQAIKTIEPHDSVERFSELGVDCYSGNAELISNHEVRVNGQTLTAKSIILATGAEPLIPDIEGIEDVELLSSDNLWQLQTLPEQLLVIGGGPIGCEMAQAFARLGSKVTIAERNSRLMKREDEDVSRYLEQVFAQEQIQVLTGHELIKLEENRATFAVGDDQQSTSFSHVLIALGRKARVQGFGLENLGIKLSRSQTIAANPFLQTNIDNIYVCGDAVAPYQFTHTASHQAWYASVNALFSPFKSFKVDYSVIPWATFTDPEVARVGINEQQAKQQGLTYEITFYDLAELDRAITEHKAHGFIKVLTQRGSDKILGACIVGEHAGDLIHEFVLAMRHKLGLNKLLSTIHIYPTWTEANKFAAANWRKNHLPSFALKVLKKFHQWRR